MTESISFDRAAGYYDETRSLHQAEMDLLVSRLLAEIPDTGACLEIGIGTGRIALPLMEGGADVVGVDVSSEMLRRLLAKRPGAKVAIADALRLPFADAAFRSAIASHVLHLIPDWKGAVGEVVRVLAPGGVFLASKGAELRAEWEARVRRRFFVEGGDPPWPPGLDTMERLDVEMRDRGAEVRVVEDVVSEGAISIAELIDAHERGIYAACWSIDDDTRRRAAAAMREWAGREFGNLDDPRPTRHSSDWRAYRLLP